MQLEEKVVLIRVIIGDDVFTHYIDQDSFTLGRSEKADLCLNIEGVSRNHLRVDIKDNRIFITDLESKYGSFLQGEEIPKNQEIAYRKSAQVFLGSTSAAFTFEIVASFNNPDYNTWKEKSKPKISNQIMGALQKLSVNKSSDESGKGFPIQRKNNEEHGSISLKESNQRELTYAAKAVMLTTDIHKLNKVREQKKRKISDLDQLIDRSELEIQRLEDQQQGLGESIKRLSLNKEQGTAALNELKTKFNQAKDKYAEKIQSYKASLEEIKKRYNEIDSKKNEAIKRESQAEFRLKELLKHQGESEQIVSQLRTEIDPLRDELTKLNNSRDELSRQLLEVENAYEAAKERKASEEEELQLALDNLAHARKGLERQKQETDELSAKSVSAIKERVEAQGTRDKLISEIKTLESNQKENEDKLMRLDSRRTRLETEVSELDRKHLKVSMELKENQNELAKAQLGLHETRQTHNELESQLDSLEEEISKYNEQAKEAKQFSEEALAEKAGLHDYFVKKRSQKSNLEEKILSREKELESILDKVSKLKAEIDEAEAKLDKVNLSRERAEIDENGLREKIQELESVNQKEEKKLIDLKLVQSDCQKQISLAQDEISLLSERKVDLKEEGDELDSEIEELSIKSSALQEKLEILNADKKNLLEKITEFERDNRKLEQKNLKLVDERKDLEKSHLDLNVDLESKQKVYDKIIKDLADSNRAEEQARERLQVLVQERDSIAVEFKDKQNELEVLLGKIEEQAQKQKQSENKLELTNEKLSLVEEKYEFLQKEFSQKESRLNEILAGIEKQSEEFKSKDEELEREFQAKVSDLESNFTKIEKQQQERLEALDLEITEAGDRLNTTKNLLSEADLQYQSLKQEIDSADSNAQKIREASRDLEVSLRQDAHNRAAEFETSLKAEIESVHRQKIIDIEKSILEKKQDLESLTKEYGEKQLELEESFSSKQNEFELKEEALEKKLSDQQKGFDNLVEEEKQKIEDALAGYSAELETKKAAYQKDLQAKLKQLDTDFKEQEHFLSTEFKQLKRRIDANMADYRHDYFTRFEFEMEQYLANKPKQVKERGPEILSLVNQCFGMANEDEEKTLTDYAMVPRADATSKTIKYYSIRAGIALALLCIVLMRGEITTGLQALLPDASKQSSSDLFVENVRRKIASKPKFQPEQKSSYQDTYTENVLHYSSYLERFSSEEFQTERIKSLSRFFADELGISENAIAPFIAEEKILINDLIDIKHNINPSYAKEGKARMKTRELKARAELIETLGGLENYNEFRRFDKSFFE